MREIEKTGKRANLQVETWQEERQSLTRRTEERHDQMESTSFSRSAKCWSAWTSI